MYMETLYTHSQNCMQTQNVDPNHMIQTQKYVLFENVCSKFIELIAPLGFLSDYYIILHSLI